MQRRSVDLANVALLLRSYRRQIDYRLEGCSSRGAAAIESRRYVQALYRAHYRPKLDDFKNTLLDVHARLFGPEVQSRFRLSTSGLISRAAKSGPRAIGLDPAHIETDLANTSDSFGRCDGSGATECIARIYWYLLKCHPFDDGNGRIARILVAQLCSFWGVSNVIVDITGIVRQALSMHNRILDSTGSLKAPKAWEQFFRGIIMPEIDSGGRIASRVQQFTASERQTALTELMQYCENASEEPGLEAGLPVLALTGPTGELLTRVILS